MPKEKEVPEWKNDFNKFIKHYKILKEGDTLCVTVNVLKQILSEQAELSVMPAKGYYTKKLKEALKKYRR